MKFKEEQLREFAKPISETEELQCKNAIRMVGDALKSLGLKESNTLNKMYPEIPSYQLSMSGGEGYLVKIFLQGSYANNTNVRSNSDVDIAVVQEDSFRPKYRQGVSRENYGFVTATPRERSFKDEVEIVLRKKFGDDVHRKNKSIKINGNSYRKDTDSVPALRFRDYTNDFLLDKSNYIGGILIVPDQGPEILNYPEQHMRNGIEKNKRTNGYFKKMVRIAKEMRYLMKDLDYVGANNISSFLVECLLWNIPDRFFIEKTEYKYIFKDIVTYLNDKKDEIYLFKEVNGIKFIDDDGVERLKYCMDFISELFRFYEYEI